MNKEQIQQIRQKYKNEIAVRFGKKIGDKKDIIVCYQTGCLCIDSEKVFNQFCSCVELNSMQSFVSVTKGGCFGLCSLGPIVVVMPEATFYTNVKVEDVEKIFENHIKNGQIVEEKLYTNSLGIKQQQIEQIDFFKKQNFIALKDCAYIDAEKIEEYIAIGGYDALLKVLDMSSQQVVDIVKQSGLRGRGGAGFLTGVKWQFCADSKSEIKYFICNADEGDPGAFMDRSILESNPQLIIEAMIIGGYAVGANKGIIYVRAEYPLASKRLINAINQARKFGLLGKNILNSNFDFDIDIRLGAGAFVCGEETALIKSVEGKRGEPRLRPPYPAESGVDGCPTNVNNVETLACIPFIINFGAEKFKKVGTSTSSGTKVFALTGCVKNTGLVELAMGSTIRELVFDVGGGTIDGKKFKAVQIGGPSGGCLDEKLLDTKIDYDSLKSVGAMMGSGGVIVMGDDTCMVDLAKFFLNFTCDESCGKCTPCRIGNTRIKEILQKICDGKGQMSDLEELKNLCNYVKNNSLCGLGQSSPNPVLSTLTHFEQEYIQHIKNKKCPAGVCKNLISFQIDKQKCVGCGACSRVCPVNAISGNKEEKFVIDPKKCIKCGLCFKTCKFNAIKRG